MARYRSGRFSFRDTKTETRIFPFIGPGYRARRSQPWYSRATVAIDSPQRAVLDMDTTGNPVHGQQDQSACNRHIE